MNLNSDKSPEIAARIATIWGRGGREGTSEGTGYIILITPKLHTENLVREVTMLILQKKIHRLKV